MRESAIEKKTCNYAKSKNWITLKLTSPSQRGVPDRLFLKNGICLFIEFKSKNKLPTKFQSYFFEKLKVNKFKVHVIDDVLTGKYLIESFD